MGVPMVVGLGNPGPTYAGNRHNLGFMVADELERRANTGFATRAHGRALAAAVRLGTGPGGVPGPRALLAKPLTFMNRSGGPVKELAAYFGADPDQIVVVHDDLDLPLGAIRLKRGGGEGGHNGLRSVSSALGTNNYLRVRLGIGRPPDGADPAQYVLRDFPSAQDAAVDDMVSQAADAVETLLLEGLDEAQLKFHTNTPPRGEQT
jgi:PTH1 family peptidyl-tRNA hydrolase